MTEMPKGDDWDKFAKGQVVQFKRLFRYGVSGILIIGFLTAGFYFSRQWLFYPRDELSEKIVYPVINDKQGGETPEETLDLLIQSLKNNDLESASRYFVAHPIKGQDWWFSLLKKAQAEGRLPEVIGQLEKMKSAAGISVYEGDYKLQMIENGILQAEIDMEKNPKTGVWKIESL